MRDRPPIRVEIGGDAELSGVLVRIVNSAYGKRRVKDADMRHRLSARTNRVLHVAYDESGTIVGCCSSTLYVPWAGPGCGHWGLLAVDPTHQGRVLCAVAAAEERLAAEGMTGEIEYSFREGEELSECLYAWYEGPNGLNYSTQEEAFRFRMCRKALTPPVDLTTTRSTLCDEEPCASLRRGFLRCRWLFCGQY